ncbi:protoporphyrinogen oxidase [Chlamydia sp.]|uniref:protoporphyrinogen oxidase n=1 Tax=Chlamydia sp. TaxID=35827 RepID=UPI0025B7F654|nr:protoporphyrinogen oxidase [Chlamydia sp.]MBQ8499015.1 protoporphyrinogen oxidase [Chlamydia sp.]
MKHALIVGSGIAGLSAGWWLHKRFPHVQLSILEKESRPGGLIVTEKHRDLALNMGPKGFVLSHDGKNTQHLIQSLGLADELLYSSPAAKTRFIHYGNKIRKVSPWTILKQNLPLTLVKDLFARPYKQDSSVEAFFKRHSSSKLRKHLLNPISVAIRAGHSHILSAQMAYPELTRREAETGSLLRSYLKTFPKNNKKEPYLATLRSGMGKLTQTLHDKLPATWHFSTPVTKIRQLANGEISLSTPKGEITGDLLIYAGSVLDLPSCLEDIPESKLIKLTTSSWDLSCVALGWHTSLPIPHGYGMLFADTPPLLGIVFNSEVFPNHNQSLTLISLLLEGRWHYEEAYAFSLAAISEYLQIYTPPQAFSLFSPQEGLPQHHVGFIQSRQRLLSKLPSNIRIVGQNFAGPGLNRAVTSAYETIASLRP